MVVVDDEQAGQLNVGCKAGCNSLQPSVSQGGTALRGSLQVTVIKKIQRIPNRTKPSPLVPIIP